MAQDTHEIAHSILLWICFNKNYSAIFLGFF